MIPPLSFPFDSLRQLQQEEMHKILLWEVEETTAATEANDDLTNDSKSNSSDERFDIQILKYLIKDLVDLVRSNGTQSRAAIIDNQLANFDDC